MGKLILLFLIYFFLLNVGFGQVDSDVARRVHSNIQGFELSKFFERSEAIGTNIIIDKIEGIDLGCSLSFEPLQVNMQYPKSGFQLFGLRKKGVICDEIVKTKAVYDGRDYNIFLIAIDTSSTKSIKPIKYISGQMFLDNISNDFELDYRDPDSYLDYLTLRMFDLQICKLKFLKKKNGVLFYEGYSNFVNQGFEVSIDTNSWNNKVSIEAWL